MVYTILWCVKKCLQKFYNLNNISCSANRLKSKILCRIFPWSSLPNLAVKYGPYTCFDNFIRSPIIFYVAEEFHLRNGLSTLNKVVLISNAFWYLSRTAQAVRLSRTWKIGLRIEVMLTREQLVWFNSPIITWYTQPFHPSLTDWTNKQRENSFLSFTYAASRNTIKRVVTPNKQMRRGCKKKKTTSVQIYKSKSQLRRYFHNKTWTNNKWQRPPSAARCCRLKKEAVTLSPYLY